MASNVSSSAGATVLDANVLIAIAAREHDKYPIATQEIARAFSLGYDLYAPGVAISETLYILRGKVQSNVLTAAEYATSVQTFMRTMVSVLPPPNGDKALIQRAEEIGRSYGCSRSADAIYIALAEELAQSQPAVILTFDQGMTKQATAHAPSVVVQLL